MNYLKSYNKNKLITYFIIITGTCCLVINLNVSYNLSYFPSNQKTYESIDNLSKYPEGLVALSTKEFISLDENDIIKIKEWLDDNQSSRSEIMHANETLIVKISYKNNFNLSIYIKKLLLIPKVTIDDIKINFKNKIIEIKLGL